MNTARSRFASVAKILRSGWAAGVWLTVTATTGGQESESLVPTALIPSPAAPVAEAALRTQAFAEDPLVLRSNPEARPNTGTSPAATPSTTAPPAPAFPPPAEPAAVPLEPAELVSIDSDTGAPGGTAISLGDRFFDSLSPNEQYEVLEFTESLPRFLADPAGDGFLYQAGQVVFPDPVELRIAGVEMGGGLVTAIERGNPFALLNILDLFHLSW